MPTRMSAGVGDHPCFLSLSLLIGKLLIFLIVVFITYAHRFKRKIIILSGHTQLIINEKSCFQYFGSSLGNSPSNKNCPR